jgi:hypothetical protein
VERAPSLIVARIEAPHFVAALAMKSGVVTEAAPIVRYMLGWTARAVAAYCERKRWHIERVPALDDEVIALIRRLNP